MRILELLLAVFLITLVSVYNLYNLSSNKPNFKSIKLYVLFIVLMLLALAIYFYTTAFLRITFITTALIIFYKLLFNDNLQKCIVTPIVSQLIVMIAEMIFAIIISLVLNLDAEQIVNTQFAQLFSNLSIAIISFIVVNLPFIKRFYNTLIRITDKIGKKHFIVFSFFTIIIANILTMLLYYRVNYLMLLIFNTFLTLFCFSIVLYSFKTKNNYNKVYDKYNTTLNSLKEYENILDRYRVSNHENKNQLLTIRNMISKTNKKTISYIDKIIENKLKDNDKVMLETAIIPAGGLRGLIYSKVLYMKELNIEYELEFSNEVKTVDLIHKIDDYVILDICKIIGVYLDNAIDEVKYLKEKYINIEMYFEGNFLVISIANNYKGKVELNKIEQKGYSTKSGGHGYGLTLTKEIINSNNLLRNEKKISKTTFTQILKIKM